MPRETFMTIGEFFGEKLGLGEMAPRDAILGQCLKLVRESIELAIEAGATPAQLERATHTPTRAPHPDPHTDWRQGVADMVRFRKEFGDVETVAKMIEYLSTIDKDDACDDVMRANRARSWAKTDEGNLQHTEGNGSLPHA